jgi:hypothetical protein
VTEAEWLACDDAETGLHFVRSRASWRKLRLFMVGCCRRVWPAITEESHRRAVEVAERFADGRAAEAEREAAFQALSRSAPLWLGSGQSLARAPLACRLCVGAKAGDNAPLVSLLTAGVAASAASPDEPDCWKEGTRQELTEQAGLVRCIFGNPFRPVKFDPHWRTDTAVSLARQMYESRDFTAIPILADAIQDAGCGNADVLDHCRNPGPHVRGCWVVDLVLEKA